MITRAQSVAARIIEPHPGPQSLFLSLGTDVALYGGAAGGGKSHALLMDVLNYVHIPGWNGLLLRRNAKDIVGVGTLYDKARELYQGTGARFREGGQYVDVRWPSGAKLKFAHVGDHNIIDYQGQDFAWVGIDEATHIDFSHIRYLITRVRSTCGVPTAIRMTCNPDPDHELAAWVEPYLFDDGYPDRSLSGVVRFFAFDRSSGDVVWGATRAEAAARSGRARHLVKSFSFVASNLSDNLDMMRVDPGYEGSLAIGGVLEAQLLGGNWHVRPETGSMFGRGRWGGIVSAPIGLITNRVRGWDVAVTRPMDGQKKPPDFTAGVLLLWDNAGRFYVAGLAACRAEPPERDDLMRRTADDDGQHVTQVIPRDPAAGGVSQLFSMRREMSRASECGPIVARAPIKNKVVRATPMANDLKAGLMIGGRREPLGYILDDGWFSEPYSDGGKDAPRTLGRLFYSQTDHFFKEGKKDDVIDAMGDAYQVGKPQPRGRRRVTPRQRAHSSV